MQCALDVPPLVAAEVDHCQPFISLRNPQVGACEANRRAVVFMVSSVRAEPLDLRVLQVGLIVPEWHCIYQ